MRSLSVELSRVALASMLATFVVHSAIRYAPGDASACGDLSELPSFSSWWAGVLLLDLGRPCHGPAGTVLGLVGPALARTSALLSFALLLSGAVGALIARGGRLGAAARAGAAALGALPAFLLAYWAATAVNLSVASCREQGSCPTWFPLQEHASWLRFSVGAIVLALGSGAAVELGRGIGAEVARARRADWVLFARATGASTPRVLSRALFGPVFALLLNRAAALASGVVVVEVVLGLNGLGLVAWEATRFRDVPVLLAATLSFSLVLGGLRVVGGLVERRRLAHLEGDR